MPLSKEQLFSWLTNLGEQYTTGVIILDQNRHDVPIVYYNNNFADLSGYTKQQLIGKTIDVLSGIKTNSMIESEMSYHLEQALASQFTILHYDIDGNAFWNSITLHPIRDANKTLQYIFCTCEDITEVLLNKMLSKLEREVYMELERDYELQNILQLITDQIEKYYIRDIYCAIHLVQPDGTLKAVAAGSIHESLFNELNTIEIASHASTQNTSIYLKDIEKNHSWHDFFTNHLNSQLSTCWAKPILNQHQKVLGSFTMYLKDRATPKRDEIDFLNHLISLISLSMKYGEQKQQLTRLAYYDVSTNTPNAHHFNNVITDWINAGIEGAIIIIQPGEYANIVDLYGRSAGDVLLGQIIERAQQHESENVEFVARFTNSAIILASQYPLNKLEDYNYRVRQLTINPYFIEDKELYITLKIGVGFFGNGFSLDDSIRQADIALSKSRATSGTNIVFFEEENDVQLQREMDILNQLSYGLTHEEFSVVLQPKINFDSAKIDGFEALARWQSHTLDHVSPAVFIPLAEQSGKIKEIDTIVIKTVLQFQLHRLKNNLKIVPIAVNISPDHFYHETFINDFLTLLNDYNVPAKYIKLEVTESIELVDFSRAKAILVALKSAGIDSSIDDFGVGFSSLSYLPQLPFSEIKIDRSFVNAMDDSGMQAVVRTIIQLASNLNMRAVAEGIETLEQLKLLKAMGCHVGQGYYFYKPLSIDDAIILLDSF